MLGTFAGPARADVCSDLHLRLGKGEKADNADAEAISAELKKDISNPYKHLVAAEVLSSVGFAGNAKKEYEEADRLQNGFVQAQFRKDLKANMHTVRFAWPYIEKKDPNDPAMLYYLSRRQLAEIAVKRDPSQTSTAQIQEQLQRAIATHKPWPGTYALLAMLEYSDAINPSFKAERQKLLRDAYNNASAELLNDPANPLALKVKMVALLKSGGNADKMQNDLQRLARIMPVDPEANIFLARAYLDKHDYAAAVKPVAIGLMTQHDPFTHNESLSQARILAHKADPDVLVKAISEVLLQPWWKKPSRIQLCFDMANELAKARHFDQAISLLALAAPHCSGDQKAMALLKIGEYFAASYRYTEAFKVLTSAIMEAKDEALTQNIVDFRQRIASLRDNTEHDVAQKIKIAILRKSGKLR